MAMGNYYIALLGIFACLTNAEAVEADQPKVTFGAYGSLGVSHSSMGSGDYVLDSGIPKGSGLSNSWSPTNDSRIAGHMAAQYSPKVSVVIQVDSEYHTGNTYEPEVEFANVKYAFTPDVYMRVGRMALPTFLESENRDIGYTYAWIHPPIEVYRQESITHSDGVDVNYRIQIGDAGNSVKALYGRSTGEMGDSQATVSLTSEHLWGVFDTIDFGPTTVHVGYQERDTNTGYRLTGQAGLSVKDSDLSVGVKYDQGNWFAMSEWIQRESTYKTNAMYLSGGYRVNKYTPYLTYAQNSQGSFLAGYPPPTPEAILLASRAQNTVSLGVRWDFMKDADFKFQYDQVQLSDSSNGFLANVPSGVNLFGARFHVISTVFDFIF
jgi:hypothetical protein